MVYLGILVGASPRKEATWDPMPRKVDKKLAWWKNKVLSLAERVCLINFVLSSLPLFFPIFFKNAEMVW